MMLYTIEISVKTRELDHMITQKKKQIKKMHSWWRSMNMQQADKVTK